MVNRYTQETIEDRLEKKYNKLENKQQKKGLLEAAEAIMSGRHTREVIKKGAKRRALNNTLENNQDTIPYSDYTKIEDHLSYGRLQKAEEKLGEIL